MSKATDISSACAIIGSDIDLRLREKRNCVVASINGSTIFEEKNIECFSDKVVPIITLMIKRSKKEGDIKIRRKGDSKILDNILNNLGNDKDISVVVLESKPDEVSDNAPAEIIAPVNQINSPVLINGLTKYAVKLGNYLELREKTMALAGSLIRTRFSSKMWGSKEVQSVMAGVAKDIKRIEADTDFFESAIEGSDRKLNSAIYFVKEEKLSEINRDQAGSVVKYYHDIKRAFVDMSQSLYKLYDIDQVFKKHIGYPTTWFLNSSILYDFQYNYENLLDEIMGFPSLEKSIIVPLSKLVAN